jgi:hypothetical protein
MNWLWALIVMVGCGAVCYGILVVILDGETDEHQNVRELTDDEKAAWGIYRIQDGAEVARRVSTRFEDRRRWDVNYLHAEAIWRMRKLNIRPIWWVGWNMIPRKGDFVYATTDLATSSHWEYTGL